MVYAKYFLRASTLIPLPPQYYINSYLSYHHFGDVFNPLYTEMPESLTVSHSPILTAGATSFTVTANDSSIIALTVNGEIIGVAQATGNPVTISIPPQTQGSNMIVTVFKQNYFRYQVTVPVVSASIIEDTKPINKLITVLYETRPNPVNNSVQVSFSIGEPSKISLKIHNVSGKLVKILANEFKSLGVYSVNWDGKDENRRSVAEGVYFYTLETSRQSFTKKLVFFK
jgi:hypothetical protein